MPAKSAPLLQNALSSYNHYKPKIHLVNIQYGTQHTPTEHILKQTIQSNLWGISITHNFCLICNKISLVISFWCFYYIRVSAPSFIKKNAAVMLHLVLHLAGLHFLYYVPFTLSFHAVLWDGPACHFI